MNKKQTLQHVQLPSSKINTNILAPSDLLVYLTIKRYMNNETKEAFPSLSTISKVCGASINTIRNSIENLKKASYIKVMKKGRSNIYKFLKYDSFEPFSYEFLDKKDLTFTEKAYLVAAQQYMIKDNGEGKISIPNTKLALKINLPESTIRKCNTSLEKKEYLTIINTKLKNKETGIKIKEKVFHLNELEQAVVFALQNHEDRIQDNEDAIKTLQKQVQSLMKDRELLIRENTDLKKTTINVF